MKILIEQGSYHLDNMGDLAMLQVAVQRLKTLWPDASIQIVTAVPEKLIKYFPNTQSLLPNDGRTWVETSLLPWISSLLQHIHGFPNHLVIQQWSNIELSFRRYSPSSVRSLIEFKLRTKPEQAKSSEDFMQAVHHADLVIATGGGYITDSFKQHGLSVIETLRLASRLDKPTVMFGQGLGPLQDQELLAKVQDVLPSLSLITLREKRAGLPLLSSMGVLRNRIMVTGDDAIELAYKARNAELGNGIGVNMRFAPYSGVNTALVETIRLVLHNAAKKWDAPLIPAPIAHLFYVGYAEPDSAIIQRILQGYDATTDGGQSLDTPVKVIEQIGHCRVVITGSYHAGVFALSQGIPVIGLAKSKYYADKFLGLADQFGIGCEVIFLDHPELKDKLADSIDRAWQSAEQLRPQLLQAAELQIELGHNAYKRVYELVNS